MNPQTYSRLCIFVFWLHQLIVGQPLEATFSDAANSDINSILASEYEPLNGTFGLEHFNYRSDALTNITFDHLQNTSFNGVTVSV